MAVFRGEFVDIVLLVEDMVAFVDEVVVVAVRA